MEKTNVKKQVISKGRKGTDKNSKKGNIVSKFCDMIKCHKIISILVIAAIIVLLIIGLFIFKDTEDVVVTINNEDYVENDFMMYYYSAKYNYFGTNDITSDDLNTMYDEDNNITVKDYLRSQTIGDLKTVAAIKMLAKNYNISLSENDYSEIDKSKQEFIKSLGGEKEFKSFLKKNNTTEESYDEMSENTKLYSKILSDVYGEGKVNDLTEDELADAKVSYKSEYYKVKQIILAIIDTDTGESLSANAINQKMLVANKVASEASSENFDEYVKKYSENVDENSTEPFDTYYKKGELLTELEEVVSAMEPNEISKPIKTKYAIHIFLKLDLDDEKLDDYLKQTRKNKCIEEIADYYNNLKVVYKEAYDKLEL